VLALQRKAWLVALVSICAAQVGCPRPGQNGGEPAPTTQPVRRGPVTTAPAVAPLPKKALAALDEIEPKIEKPVNPKGARDVPARAADAVAEAEVAIGRREYVAAINRLERAVGFAPANPRMRRALGLAYAGLLNRGKALDNLRIAVKGAPDDLEVQVLLGRLAAAQKQNTTAGVALRTALVCSEADNANPLVGEALLTLGTLLGAEGYHTAALECYERLGANIERHGRDYASRPVLRAIVLHSERLLTYRGELLLKLRKPTQAAELLARSRKRDRTSVTTARLLLKALLEAKDVPAATAVFHELAGETNTKPVAGQLAGDLCRAAGDKTLPLKLWRGRRVRGQYDGALAVALARAARELDATDDAMTILQELLAVVPNDVAAGRALVTLCAERGRGDQALGILSRLLGSGGTGLAGARAGLAELAQAKLPDDFERTFAARIKTDKPEERAALYYVCGELARLRAKLALSADLLEKALKAKKDFLPAFEALADVYAAQKRFDKVDELLAGLSDASGDRYRTLVIRGKLQLTRGIVRKAIADFTKARELNGGEIDLLLMLAEAYRQVGSPGQAVSVLMDAHRRAPGERRVLRMLFRLCLEPVGGELRLLPHANIAVTQLAKTDPDGLDVLLMRAELAIIEKKFIGAKDLVGKLQARAPTDRRVQMLAVWLDVASRWEALNANQRADLVRKARGFVVADPGDVEATRLLARALVKAGKAAEVPGLWRLLHRKRPGDLRVAVICAEKLREAKKFSEAADVLARVVRSDPENVFHMDELIRMLIAAKRYAEAAEHCESVLKAKLPSQAAEFFRDRLVYLYSVRLKACDKAQKLLDDMILVTGNDERLAELRARKIQVYGRADQLDRAEKYAAGWIEQEPDTVLPRMMLTLVLSDAKQFARAIKLVDGWLKARAGADKDDAVLLWCRQYKVRLLMRAERHAEALKQAEAFLKLAPKDHELLALKSNCLTELGRHKDAVAAMEKAFAVAPDDVQINNNLAYIYADRGINLDKAERYVRRSLAEKPDIVAYMDTLAWVFYKKGDFGAAVRKFELILKRKDLDEQGHPVVFDHAGDAFYRAGKPDRAVTLWRRALDLAKKETSPAGEVRQVLKLGPKKIEAVKAGTPPAVAPLGQGVKDPTDKAPDEPKPPEAGARKKD